MPVKSSNSSVLKWPDRKQVVFALEQWADSAKENHPELSRVGYYGSYARGDWGVGSDLDVIIIVDESKIPLMDRTRNWNVTGIPVHVDLLVFTRKEWQLKKNLKQFDDIVFF